MLQVLLVQHAVEQGLFVLQLFKCLLLLLHRVDHTKVLFFEFVEYLVQRLRIVEWQRVRIEIIWHSDQIFSHQLIETGLPKLLGHVLLHPVVLDVACLGAVAFELFLVAGVGLQVFINQFESVLSMDLFVVLKQDVLIVLEHLRIPTARPIVNPLHTATDPVVLEFDKFISLLLVALLVPAAVVIIFDFQNVLAGLFKVHKCIFVFFDFRFARLDRILNCFEFFLFLRLEL